MKYISNKKYVSIVLISILIVGGLPFIFEIGTDFSTARAEADLDLECTEPTKDVTPNLSGNKAFVEYDVTVWNRGLESDWFTIEVTKLNHAQYVKLSSLQTQSLSPDSSATITVTIEIDNKKTKTSATDPSNPHLLTNFTATSNKNSSKFESIILTTNILQAYGVELSTPYDILETPESFTGVYREVIYDINVKNIGTGTDDFKLELLSENKEWGSLSQSNVNDLEQDTTETVTLTVKVPKDESQGDNLFNVLAISRGDDTVFDDSNDEYDDLVCMVKVTQYYDVDIPSPITTYTALPGETIPYPDFTIKNRGNGQDDIRIETTGPEDLDWSPKVIDKILSKSGTTDSSANIIITTTIPTDMLAGTYYINISVKSDTPTGYIEHIDILTFMVKIDQVYDVDISTEDDLKDAKPGETKTYNLKIWNRGNGRDTFDLFAIGEKSDWVTFENNENSITLESGNSTIIDVTVSIPSLSEVSDIEEIKPGSYEVTIKTVSDGDNEVDDTLPLTINVKVLYGLEFYHITTATDVNPLTIDTTDPDGGKFNFIIKNIGNSVDTISLGTTNVPAHWLISYNYQNFTLATNESKEIIATIKFSNGVKSSFGRHFIITARSNDGSLFIDPEKVYVDVLQYDLKIIHIETEEDITAGDTSTITATVRNQGTGTAEEIEIKFYDGNEYLGSVIVPEIGPGDEEKVEFDWKPSEGEHELKVGVENPDDRQRTGETKTTVKPNETEDILSSILILIIIIVAIFSLIIIMIFLLFIKKKKKKFEPNQMNGLSNPRIDSHWSDNYSPPPPTSHQSRQGSYGSHKDQYQALYKRPPQRRL